MEIDCLPDAEAVAERTARLLAQLATAARAVHGEAHVCLAGGSTPLHAYDLLGDMVDDWERIHLWYGDERCVPFDHADSNHGAAISRLRAPGATWHPMPGELPPEEGAAAYAAELGETVLDVTLLGMGPDGHVASLFPDHALLDATAAVAAITDSPKPPPKRITLTMPKLNESRRIVLAVTGQEKAAALRRARATADRATPASLLERSVLEIVADEAACG